MELTMLCSCHGLQMRNMAGPSHRVLGEKGLFHRAQLVEISNKKSGEPTKWQCVFIGERCLGDENAEEPLFVHQEWTPRQL